MTKLQPGNEAPAFTLPNHDGTSISLADYAGGKVILYFYPAALTPGCTTQAVDFSTYHADFAQAGIEILGISPDTPAKLTAFRAKKELSIELLADESRQTIKAYGAWGIKKLYGKEIEGLIRSTFMVKVDDQGKGTIEEALYNVRASGHVERLRRQLGLMHL